MESHCEYPSCVWLSMYTMSLEAEEAAKAVRFPMNILWRLFQDVFLRPITNEPDSLPTSCGGSTSRLALISGTRGGGV
jgi:hypothetical protein